MTVIGLFPFNGYQEVVGPGLGGLVGVEGEAFPGMGLTVRGGYIQHSERNEYARVLIPILGGAKITSYSSSLYAAAEAGRVSMRDEYKGEDPLAEDHKRTKTAWSVGAGSASDRLDVRLSLFVWDAANYKETMTVGLTLSFLILGF